MEYLATGVMSGTSLDGLDISWCYFQCKEGQWTHKILIAETIPYPARWQLALGTAATLSGRQLIELHVAYGHYIGQTLRDFFVRHQIGSPGVIACHGHTIFHRPDLGYTFQLGSGAAIAAEVSAKLICDFRSLDVALQGQGAPLVPIGDQLLFHEYDYCLNLGGFANTSFEENGKRRAYDICPLNFVINRLVEQQKVVDQPGKQKSQANPEHHLRFDPGGSMARKGFVDEALLNTMNALPFYHEKGAKSLGHEWVDEYIWPHIANSGLNFFDKLRTYYEHAAIQIGQSFSNKDRESVLLTGGGCYNDFLVELIRDYAPDNVSLVLADPQTIEFKEALIFAFLGVLYLREESNCLSSVTGSTHSNIGGSMYFGSKKISNSK